MQNALAVHRAALFNVLHDAVLAQGLPLRTSSQVVTRRDGALVCADGHITPRFDLIVDALGSRSPLIPHAAAADRRRRLDYGALWTSLPWLGGRFDAAALEQRYARAAIMIGVLPIGRRHEEDTPQTAFFWSLKTNAHDDWLARGLDAWKEQVLRLWPDTGPLIELIATPAQMVMAGYDHHTLPLPYGERIVFIGDSAHSTSPQLGQGANMALLDVHALSNALATTTTLDAALRCYADERRFHVRLYQAMSRVFTPFYQSDSRLLPWLRDAVVPLVGDIPPIARLLATIVAGRLGTRRRARRRP